MEGNQTAWEEGRTTFPWFCRYKFWCSEQQITLRMNCKNWTLDAVAVSLGSQDADKDSIVETGQASSFLLLALSGYLADFVSGVHPF